MRGVTCLFTMYYSSLIQELAPIQVEKRFISGFCFLYIQSASHVHQLESLIIQAANTICYKKKISYECSYVRPTKDGQLFRIRFLAPTEKMFCCGNECTDCVREIRKK